MSVRKMSNLGLASTTVAYKSFLAGNLTYVPFTPTGSFESIATVTVGAGGTSSVDFTSIPSTYQHLQVRCFVMPSSSVTYYSLRLNNDTGANYTYHQLVTDGATTYSNGGTGTTEAYVQNTLSATNPNISIIDLFD